MAASAAAGALRWGRGSFIVVALSLKWGRRYRGQYGSGATVTGASQERVTTRARRTRSRLLPSVPALWRPSLAFVVQEPCGLMILGGLGTVRAAQRHGQGG